MSTRKLETYRLSYRTDMRQIVQELNMILARIEDRLDEIEGLRLDYFTTQRWEKDFLRED